MPPVRRTSGTPEQAKVRRAVQELESAAQQAAAFAFGRLDGYIRELDGRDEQVFDPIDLTEALQCGRTYVDEQLRAMMGRAREHLAGLVADAVREAEARSARRRSPPDPRPTVRARRAMPMTRGPRC